MAMSKIKTTAAVFELPQKLGIIQYVEYVPEKRCADGGCLYEGILTAEGCRRGICVKYRMLIHSRDRKNWIIERRTRMEWGGCVPPAVADALWELSGKYDVGVWYEYRYLNQFGCMFDCVVRRDCYLLINGVKLSMPYHCRSIVECVEQILEYYKREVEKLKEPPAVSTYNPAEELLRRWPELEAFGVEWVKAWAPHARERLVEIAEVMRRYPWMVEVVKKKKTANPNPHVVEAYVAADGSEVCLLLAPSKAYCAQNGAIKAMPLEMSCYYVEKKRMCRPKGLLAFAAAKEYVRIL